MHTFLPVFQTKKPLFIIPVVILLFVLAQSFLLQKPPTDIVYTVHREDLVDTVTVSGTYTTASQTDVLSPAKGIITEIFAPNNSFIQKGDPLFHVESTATDEQKANAYADFMLAKANLDNAKASQLSLQADMFRKWDSFKSLSENDTYENGDGTPRNDNRSAPQYHVAEKDWLATEAQYKNQQEVVAAAQAALTQTTLAYNATRDITVKAPASGTIVNFQKKVGDQVGQTLPVLLIADLRNASLTTSINEVYIPHITTGQKATIIFDALKEKTFTGTVESVDTIGTNTGGVISYAARIRIDTLPPTIKPNMTALIRIETLRKNNVLLVPNSAISTQGEKTYVKSAKNQNLLLVETGIKGFTKTEILNGISEGTDIVANANSQNL